MNMFDEISREKKELPKINTITKQLTKYELNTYQKFAFAIWIISFVLGIILGNIFSTCDVSGNFYNVDCVNREFNMSVMFLVWFSGFTMGISFLSIFLTFLTVFLETSAILSPALSKLSPTSLRVP